MALPPARLSHPVQLLQQGHRLPLELLRHLPLAGGAEGDGLNNLKLTTG